MAIRNIRLDGDDILRKTCRSVTKMDDRTLTLIDDMFDTMYEANGVGLAAPQIGENYRVFVIDVSTGNEPLNPMVFINPKIIKKSGAVISHEGCLSFPEAFTDVRRYANVMIKALDRNGRSFVLEAKDGTLLARAIQHEFDHLDGILFIDHVINRFEAEEVLKKHNLPDIQVDKILDEPELAAQIEVLLKEKVENEKSENIEKE